MRCHVCRWNYPDALLAWVVTADGPQRVCAIDLDYLPTSLRDAAQAYRIAHPEARNPSDPMPSVQSLIDAQTADLDARAQADIDNQKAVKAAVITSLWGRLGRQPTAQELAAERTRFVNIYKAL